MYEYSCAQLKNKFERAIIPLSAEFNSKFARMLETRDLNEVPRLRHLMMVLDVNMSGIMGFLRNRKK